MHLGLKCKNAKNVHAVATCGLDPQFQPSMTYISFYIFTPIYKKALKITFSFPKFAASL